VYALLCILHVLTSILLCVSLIFPHSKKCWFGGRHVMKIICNFLVTTVIAELLFKEFADSYCCVTGWTLLTMKNLPHGHMYCITPTVVCILHTIIVVRTLQYSVITNQWLIIFHWNFHCKKTWWNDIWTVIVHFSDPH